MKNSLSLAVALGLALIAAPSLNAQQTPDRSKAPALGPVPSLTLPPIVKRTLTNGLSVWIVEMHKVPLVDVTLLNKSGSAK